MRTAAARRKNVETGDLPAVRAMIGT